MKLDRNKMIFITIVTLVVLFIVGYGFLVMGEGDDVKSELTQPVVPELKEEQKEYSSKLDAINDLKEVRESNAPSIYDESLLDSTGLYDSMYQEKERQRIVDSIYASGRINYKSGEYNNTADISSSKPMAGTPKNQIEETVIDFAKAHHEFFAYEPKPVSLVDLETTKGRTDDFVMVEVNGEQTVKSDERLELRLAVDALINGDSIPRNSLVYGFVRFNANRVFITITNINNKLVDLKAFDLLDGNEGIYIRNSFTGEATTEVIGDVVEDINIPGVPQVGGVKQVFRRNNRNVKVTVYNQYQLILKPAL
ncbi:conjugative transposon protein TraM [Algoriphagus sp. NBT04N3]|uniref:conjugative transposon protein TraM n=1 Tax=Algoriphagus sp. NBT04N3 TaxID=2705473 RepID=UPI001C6363A6|nr:conjugative transposon protein TraM [Algoriphagus sp. NBT04N3]QYH37883.1 conjugative transposon protein TraM [Algoriphagus sp. NBT04N3]